MDIALDNIVKLGYEQVSEPNIRQALADLDQSKVALDEAKKAHSQAELELPASEWEDAKIEADARAADQPAPKSRTHTAKRERLIRDLAHELKVAVLTADRAQARLTSIVNEAGPAWAAEVKKALGAMRQQWNRDLQELIALHARMGAANTVARAIGLATGTVQVADVNRGLLKGVELASGSPETAHVPVPDLLAILSDLGAPEPEPTRVVQPPLSRQPSANESMAGVEAEIREREVFAADRAKRGPPPPAVVDPAGDSGSL
jgi:hypothetical protein